MDDSKILQTPTSPAAQNATNNMVPSSGPRNNPDFTPLAGHCGQGGNVK